MAISTYKVFLMHKAEDGGVYEKLVDIKDFPDLGGARENIETTTLSDPMQTFIPGIQSSDGLAFTANYTKTDYDKIKALKDKDLDLAVWFGGEETGGTLTPTGSDGKFEFKGQIDVVVNGGGVNEAVGMTINATPSTPITKGE